MTDIADKDPALVDTASTNGSSDPTLVTTGAIVTTSVTPGAINKLSVPREDIGAGITPSEELDVVALGKKKIRKPGRREWIRLNMASEMTTRLLPHRPNPNGMDEEHYYITPELRQPIQDELKNYRVFDFYSVQAKSHSIWLVPVTDGGSWYESLQPLFSQPLSFFDDNEVLIKADKPASVYRVRFRPATCKVDWPTTPIDQLLGEALGESRFITTAEHPLYSSLIGGQEL